MKNERKEKNIKNDKNQNGLNGILSKYWLVIGAFLVIVLIKAILSLSMYSPFIIPDELVYDSMAQNVLNGFLAPKITGPIGPGYPVLLSIAYLFSGDKEVAYHIMLAIGSIVSTSIMFPAYFIMRKYCSDMISFMGSITVAALPFLSFFSFTLMTENLFTPLFIFSLWFFIESLSTDDKKWQILTSASVAYLYITRSNAVAMIAGLLVAFAYYAIVSSKGKDIVDTIVKKSYLLITLVIFMLSWLVYSLDPSKSLAFALIMALVAIGASWAAYWLMERKSAAAVSLLKDRRTITAGAIVLALAIIVIFAILFINGKGGQIINYGSSYPAAGIATSLFQVIASTDNMIIGSVVFIDEILYAMVCSFFALTIIVFYHIYYKKKTYDKASPLTAGLVYALVSLTVIALTVVGLRFYTNENIFMIGRYVEPIIPAIIIYGVIYLNDMKNVNDKQLLYFIGLFVGTFVVSLFLMEIDYSVIYGFNEYVNNPSLVYLEPLYKMPLPELWVLIYSMAFMALMYLSIKNKRYISVLLIFIIISSLIPAADLFGRAVDSGNFRMNNPINLYLNANSKGSTHLYIDENMTDSQQKVGFDIYAFWNKGYTEHLNTNTTSASIETDDAYVISVNELPYKFITNDYIFKLYKIS